MSIRSLTTRLREETEELRKRRRFDLSRAKEVAPAASAPPQPTYRPLPAGDAVPLPMARQVRLKKRAEEETWRIPGGIAARFGRQAFQHPQPVAQPAAEMPIPEALPEVASDTQQQPPKPEREARKEATRITIELQSH